MNKNDYIQLLNKPYSVNGTQAQELEQLLQEFPYLQSARAFLLKALYNQDSFRYNSELKKTAAYTTDRSVLFDFITSEQFQSIQSDFHEQQQKQVEDIIVTAAVPVVATPENTAAPDKAEESVKLSIKVAEPEAKVTEFAEEQPVPSIPATTETPGEKLEMGKPLAFDSGEKHSFAEWLQLSKLSPINRETHAPAEIETTETTETGNAPAEAINRKLELIDRFIETNPKIVPVRGSIPAPANIDKGTQENTSLMTETLARVYLEQKKYQKAIQAYEILILKYPEKSVFFADRILEIKNLQQNNN